LKAGGPAEADARLTILGPARCSAAGSAARFPVLLPIVEIVLIVSIDIESI
jgi:hypothetical protein